MEAFAIRFVKSGKYVRLDSRFVHGCETIHGAELYKSYEQAQKTIEYFAEQAKLPECDGYNPLENDDGTVGPFDICRFEIAEVGTPNRIGT